MASSCSIWPRRPRVPWCRWAVRPATCLAGPTGPLLIPDESDDQFVEMSLPTGRVLQSVTVGRQPHDSVAVGPDSVSAADELADTIHIVRHGQVIKVVAAP